jgi:predicted SnoaL-like aldol condensation-catalyzing enzyme
MTGSDSDSTTHGIEGVKRLFRDRYPKLYDMLSSARQNPMSGDTLRILMNSDGQEEQTELVRNISPPVMWQRTAPIVLSNYIDFGSVRLPGYWNSIVPEIKQRYGNIIQYEHRDVTISRRPPFRLAIVGRAIQHRAGDEAFWQWFDHIVVEDTFRVEDAFSVDEAIDLVDELDIDVEKKYLNEAVEDQLYKNLMWDEVDSLLRRTMAAEYGEHEKQLAQGKAVFVVLVNGKPVQPTYDSIVDAIEDVIAVNQS